MNRPRWLTGAVPGLLLLAGAAAAVKSVPYYARWIVAMYVVLTVVLAVAVLRGRPVGVSGRHAGALVLATAGVLTYLVPTFTYLPPASAATVRTLVAAGAAAVAAVFGFSPRWHRQLAVGLAAAVFAVGSAAVVHLDPAPHIDVWYTLQGAADGVVHGQDMYTQVWPDSPGQQDAFTYLPWTAVLLAPFRLCRRRRQVGTGRRPAACGGRGRARPHRRRGPRGPEPAAGREDAAGRDGTPPLAPARCCSCCPAR